MARLKATIRLKGPDFEEVIGQDLQQKIYKAAKANEEELKAKIKSALDAKWPWPRDPTNRDIVETGTLRDATQVETTKGSGVVIYTISYPGVVYAAMTYHGGYIQPYGNKAATRVFLPPRPWIDAKLVGGYGNISVYNLAAAIKRETKTV